jgi:type VI secretion system secreted protein VgrG
MSDAFELVIDGTSWKVSAMRGREAVSEPFSFEVVAFADGAAPLAIGAEAKLSWPLEDGGVRAFTAVVDGIEERAGRDAAPREAVIRLEPRLSAVLDGAQHAVFLDQDALDIAEAVLSAHRVRLERRCERSLPKRAQRVQAFESDLHFVTRILADEGILWFLHPEEADVIVAVDNPSGFLPIAGERLSIRPPRGLVTDRSVWGVSIAQRAASDKVTLRDFNFRAPSADLTVEVTSGEGRSERYEYGGGYTKTSVGERLAQIRLEEHRRDRIVLRGKTSALGFAPGCSIELEGGPIDSINGAWILTSVEHEGTSSGAAGLRGDGRLFQGAERRAPAPYEAKAPPDEERPYTASFTAVPKDAGYRPARPHRAALRKAQTERAPREPAFGGVQTMDVTGSSGAEIHTDDLGRVKARFRWERTRPADDTSSAWLRSVQPPTSGGFFLPRVGWQVLTAFVHGSPDEPLALGRLYTGVDPPPAALPGQKVRSDLVTRTTPGGGSVSGVQIDDTAGNENMAFTASKNFNERTENDKVTAVTSNDTWEIGGDRSTVVAKVYSLKINGSQTVSVGGGRTLNVDANKMIKAASESVSIGGARMFDVGGDSHTQASSLARMVGAAKMVAPIEHETQLVTGASSTLVGGAWNQLSGLSASVDVGGVSAETVAGPKMIKATSYSLHVRGALTESFASKKVDAGADVVNVASSKSTLRAGGGVKLKGADVVFTASTKIQIKAGGVTIKITPGSVTIQGQFKSSQSAADDSNEDYD